MQYQWESRRQVGFSEPSLPKFDGSQETLKYQWSTLATAEEIAKLANCAAKSTGYVDMWSLLDTVDDKTGTAIVHFLQERGPMLPKSPICP